MGRPHRFHVDLPPAPVAGLVVNLAPPVAHQVARVLRMRSGEVVHLFDGNGGEWRAVIRIGSGNAVTATLDGFLSGPSPLGSVVLCLGLLKGEKFDWVIQKSTELGITHVIPMVTERSLPGSGRPDRWHRIAVEASEQSGRTTIPEITPPMPLRDALNFQSTHSVPGSRVICWEDERTVPFLAPVRLARMTGAPVFLYIGPEGGFSATEVDLALASGAQAVSLGTLILRSETAAIAAVTLAVHAN